MPTDNYNAEMKLMLTDILLISETHFTGKSYLKSSYYEVYHTNHPDNKSAMLIKSTDYYELPKYEKDYLQATSIKIKIMQYELTVSGVYCPPRDNIRNTSKIFYWSKYLVQNLFQEEILTVTHYKAPN